MLPSTPSAEDAADAAFASARVARLRRLRARHRPGPTGVAGAILVLLVAVVITRHNSASGDRLGEIAANRTLVASTAAQQSGTGCVGWPVALTPSVKPRDLADAVSIWGERSAFHLRNVGADAVVVEIRAAGGAARGLDDGMEGIGGGVLIATVGPALEVRFTVACSATALSLRLVGRDGHGGAGGTFQFGTGAVTGPVTIEKASRP